MRVKDLGCWRSMTWRAMDLADIAHRVIECHFTQDLKTRVGGRRSMRVGGR